MSAELSLDFITMAATIPVGCVVTKLGTFVFQKCIFPARGSGAKIYFNMGDVINLAIL